MGRYYDESGDPNEAALNRATDYGNCPDMGPVAHDLARLERRGDRAIAALRFAMTMRYDHTRNCVCVACESARALLREVGDE